MRTSRGPGTDELERRRATGVSVIGSGTVGTTGGIVANPPTFIDLDSDQHGF